VQAVVQRRRVIERDAAQPVVAGQAVGHDLGGGEQSLGLTQRPVVPLGEQALDLQGLIVEPDV
jgi:hypothetical protein